MIESSASRNPSLAATSLASDDGLARLRDAGESDAVLGLERTTEVLLREMVSRQRVLKDVGDDIHARREKARIQHDRTLASIRQTRKTDLDQSQKTHDGARDEALRTHADASAEARSACDLRLTEISSACDTELTRLKRSLEESLLMAEAMKEAGEDEVKAHTRELNERLRVKLEVAASLETKAKLYLKSCRLKVPTVAGEATHALSMAAEAEIDVLLQRGAEHLAAVLESRASRLLSGVAPILLSVAIVVGAGVIGGAATLFDPLRWAETAGYSALGAFVFVLIMLFTVRRIAARAMRRVWAPFQADLAAIALAKVRAESEEVESREARLFRLSDAAQREEFDSHKRLDGPIAEVPRALKRRIERAQSATAATLAALDAQLQDATTNAKSEHTAQLAAIETRAADDERTELARAADERATLASEEEARLCGARDHWVRTATDCRDALIDASIRDAALNPAWSAFDFQYGGVASACAPWFRFGSLAVHPARLPGGLPDDPAFVVPMPDTIEIPAALGFPHRGNLLFLTTPQSRPAALAAVQSLVTRLLVSIPPSKVRFTFIDPVGLGESFAAFMHLGDEYEQLVGERIWTEPRAIEQRLVDISEHMETVIQKYLRNEFEDIDAYNLAAGEIAEPYRFLICADFPANFSEQAAARMNSILRAGQRCGVHVILLRDAKSTLPDGISATDIEASCQVVRTDGAAPHSAAFASGPFASLPLTLDTPPRDELLIPMLSRVARVAKTSARVEVPFDAIAPKGDAFWSLSSAKTLKVPVGRAGATRLQQFLLGEGTSQHALIAGKTGSGKSTLLHAIITGLATWYSPDEVELWLVDFKKGVEFKTYAEHALPHARAVAIESDREFGLSVLEGLDAELSRRGEAYREVGVQDIASYRAIRPEVRMPRVLLVIDEFQEFFLDDDRVAQSASMLLDRIVRQGRAFGIHALLGSQTLGGAYSLARSTMGQMGVRIALQCTEADSQLILSDENLAARLLSRPGEAIYNDAGGRVEGNSPFQVAYLPDAKRDTWLDAIEERARGRYDALPRIVFEGDARAAMALHPGLRATRTPDARGNVRVWLGEAVAIKDPTCATLARAAGANITAISPRDDQAVATTAAFILSLSREAPDATIDVLDGTPADAPEYGVLERFARDRGITANFVPYRELEAKLAEIAEDVTARAETAGRARRFLVIHQLQRYRSLRRNEDDYSFSASDAPLSADKLLGGILREGPVCGVHTLVMSDTLSSLQRVFDRNALREFDWKVLFQISPADSSTLIDAPSASRLGTNRGLLHSEELGMLEKFRPYAL